MSIDPKEVVKLTSEGIVFGCAACKHMHQAIDNGFDGCQKQCGSPLSGHVFEKYKGPVSKDYWPQICWVCGDESDMGLRFMDHGITLGACEAHETIHDEGDADAGPVLVIGKSTAFEKENLIQELYKMENEGR